jgi:hypothetical protein
MRQHLAFTGDLFPTSQNETHNLIKQNASCFEFNRKHFFIERDSFVDADNQEISTTYISDTRNGKVPTAYAHTTVVTKDGVIQHIEIESSGESMWERPTGSRVETNFVESHASKPEKTVTPRKLYPQRLLDTILREQFLSHLPQYSDIAYSIDMARLWQYPTNIPVPNLDVSHPKIDAFKMSLDLVENTQPQEYILSIYFLNNSRFTLDERRVQTENSKKYRIYLKFLNPQVVSDQKWISGQVADFSREFIKCQEGKPFYAYVLEEEEIPRIKKTAFGKSSNGTPTYRSATHNSWPNRFRD